MTGARFGEVDLDLLADYLVGVLDEADESRVAGLIASDAAWAGAYRELSSASEAVEVVLGELGRESTGPMPADVAARIDEALRGAGIGQVISLEDRRQRRHKRLTAVAAVAASVLTVFAGVTVVRVVGSQGGNNVTSAGSPYSDSGAPGVAPQAEGGAGDAGAPALVAPSVIASGRDYRETDLRLDSAAIGKDVEDLTATQPPTTRAADVHVPTAVPAELRDLAADPSALQRCLAAVAGRHPGALVTGVDLARYQGRPAVVVVLARGTVAVDRIVVVDPGCKADLATFPD